jgi:L-ornithine Nalpha-acyltransferase
VASFHGTDVAELLGPLSYLHHFHLAPPNLRARARTDEGLALDYLHPNQIDRLRAMQAMPALIKAYLRLGGFIGEGVYIDRAFNTTDVCLVMDTALLPDRQRRHYVRQMAQIE